MPDPDFSEADIEYLLGGIEREARLLDGGMAGIQTEIARLTPLLEIQDLWLLPHESRIDSLKEALHLLARELREMGFENIGSVFRKDIIDRALACWEGLINEPDLDPEIRATQSEYHEFYFAVFRELAGGVAAIRNGADPEIYYDRLRAKLGLSKNDFAAFRSLSPGRAQFDYLWKNYLQFPEHPFDSRDLAEIISNADPDSKFGLVARAHYGTETDEDIELCTRAIALDPDFLQAYYFRGQEFHYADRFEEAVADFDVVLRLDPDLTRAHHFRAGALADLKDYEGAIGSYNAIIESADEPDAQKGFACYYRGIALHELNRLSWALTSFEESVRLNPGYSYALACMGFTLLGLGRREEAIAAFREIPEERIVLSIEDFLATLPGPGPVYLNREQQLKIFEDEDGYEPIR